MFLCNKKTKVIHKPSCRLAKSINPENLRKYETVTAALEDGYCFCKRCSSVNRIYLREKINIDAFAKENKIICELKDGVLYVATPYDKWLIVSMESKGRVELYHKNATKRKGDYCNAYHRQRVVSQSIIYLLKYIMGHNDYKQKSFVDFYSGEEGKRHLKKSRAKNEKNKRIRKRKNVDNLKTVDFLLSKIKEE